MPGCSDGTSATMNTSLALFHRQLIPLNFPDTLLEDPYLIAFSRANRVCYLRTPFSFQNLIAPGCIGVTIPSAPAATLIALKVFFWDTM